MALIPCPECEKEVSSYAKVCPFCGYPNPASGSPQEKEEKISQVGKVIFHKIFGTPEEIRWRNQTYGWKEWRIIRRFPLQYCCSVGLVLFAIFLMMESFFDIVELERKFPGFLKSIEIGMLSEWKWAFQITFILWSLMFLVGIGWRVELGDRVMHKDIEEGFVLALAPVALETMDDQVLKKIQKKGRLLDWTIIMTIGGVLTLFTVYAIFFSGLPLY